MSHDTPRLSVVGGICLAMSVADNFAQTERQGPVAVIPVQDFLARGPVKLTASELRSLLMGATTRGPHESGGTSERRYGADGTWNGRDFVGASGQFDVSATWRVNEKDQVCYSGTATGGAVGKTYRFSNCSDWYKLGEHYYVLGERSPALLRQVAR